MKPAGLLRRIAALFYDGIILFALLMVSSAIAVVINHNQAIKPGDMIFTGYLLLVMFAYFAWSWIYPGQTIGMRAWRMRIHTMNNEPMDLWRCLLRFGFAIPALLLAGIGLWWMLFDKKKLCWYDKWSGSYLADVSKNQI